MNTSSRSFMRKSKDVREDSLQIRQRFGRLLSSIRRLRRRIARGRRDDDPARDGAGGGQSARREAMFPALETKAVFHGEKEGRRFQMRLPCAFTASYLYIAGMMR